MQDGLATLRGFDLDLLTPEEAARIVKRTPQWLAIGRSQGYGPPYHRLGRNTIRYQRQDIVDWLTQNSHDPSL